MTQKLPTRPSRRAALGMMTSAAALAACTPNHSVETGRPLGSNLDTNNTFGEPTRNNIGVQNGDIEWTAILGQRFAETVPTTINFAFNSAELDATARGILDQQAQFIRHFPEVRFSVYGHTDAVGSAGYNQRLGRRRARTVVNYLVFRGVNRHRLAALVSLGESQPVVMTEAMERRNRRTVTEVSGFISNNPLILDGQYARVVYRTYASGGGGGAAAAN